MSYIIRLPGKACSIALFAVLLAGCSGGIDTTGVSGGGLGDYLWGSGSSNSSSKSSSSSKAALASSNGDAIAPDLEEVDKTEPIAKLYNEGLEKLNDGSYKSANKKFSEVERQHPYSQWATRAILMQAYSSYMRNEYDDSINASDRFITLHPGHKDAAYAYYLKALCYYEQIQQTTRDQTATKKALSALEEVGQRFPGTTYAQDAASKAVLARDHLAGKEMEVGRYYQKKKAYTSAINRFKKVVIDYQTTSQTPEALYRLTETYMVLGVRSEAQTAAAILGHNYPNSQWYKDAFNLLQSDGLSPVENKASWISRAVNSIVN